MPSMGSLQIVAFLVAAAASWLRGGVYRWDEPAAAAEEQPLPRAAALSR